MKRTSVSLAVAAFLVASGAHAQTYECMGHHWVQGSDDGTGDKTADLTFEQGFSFDMPGTPYTASIFEIGGDEDEIAVTVSKNQKDIGTAIAPMGQSVELDFPGDNGDGYGVSCDIPQPPEHR